MTYQEWKALNKSKWQLDIKEVMEFESLRPIDAMEYKKRLAEEKKKRSDIAGIKDRSKRLKAIAENMHLFE